MLSQPAASPPASSPPASRLTVAFTTKYHWTYSVTNFIIFLRLDENIDRFNRFAYAVIIKRDHFQFKNNNHLKWKYNKKNIRLSTLLPNVMKSTIDRKTCTDQFKPDWNAALMEETQCVCNCAWQRGMCVSAWNQLFPIKVTTCALISPVVL